MAKINTRYDNVLPRLPRDESAAEQRQFNESILKAIENLFITANADVTKINSEREDTAISLEEVWGLLCIIQLVQNHVTAPYSYAYTTTRANAVEIACLTTSITTKRENSKIAIDAILGVEAYWNSVLFITRTVESVETEIGSAPGEGDRTYGMTAGSYDNNHASTPSMHPMQYIDEPEVPANTTITYKIKIYGGQASTIFINRTYEDYNSPGYERITSNIRLSEIMNEG